MRRQLHADCHSEEVADKRLFVVLTEAHDATAAGWNQVLGMGESGDGSIEFKKKLRTRFQNNVLA